MTGDFFRARLDQMIDLRHPLAVLASRMPWDSTEAALTPLLAHKDRMGQRLEGADRLGPTLQVAGSGVSAAGRPRLSIRLLEMARAKLVRLAQRAGITLKQTYAREGQSLRRRAGGYAHAKQFKRLRKALKRQRTAPISGLLLERRAQPLGHRVARQPRLTGDLPLREPLALAHPPDPAYHVHGDHSGFPAAQKKQQGR